MSLVDTYRMGGEIKYYFEEVFEKGQVSQKVHFGLQF
jgi:hypothetical protein